MMYHNERANKLGPEYFCPRCTLDIKDFTAKPYTCPKCPLTRSYIIALEGLQPAQGARKITLGVVDEVYKRFANGEKVWPFPFTIENVMHVYNIVSQKLSDIGGIIPEHWDETTATIARIIKSEERQYTYTKEYGKAQTKGKPVENKIPDR